MAERELSDDRIEEESPSRDAGWAGLSVSEIRSRDCKREYLRSIAHYLKPAPVPDASTFEALAFRIAEDERIRDRLECPIAIAATSKAIEEGRANLARCREEFPEAAAEFDQRRERGERIALIGKSRQKSNGDRRSPRAVKALAELKALNKKKGLTVDSLMESFKGFGRQDTYLYQNGEFDGKLSDEKVNRMESAIIERAAKEGLIV